MCWKIFFFFFNCLKPAVPGSKGSSCSGLPERLLVHRGGCTGPPSLSVPDWSAAALFFQTTLVIIHFPSLQVPPVLLPFTWPQSGVLPGSLLKVVTDAPEAQSIPGVCWGGGPDFGIPTLSCSLFCHLGCPVRYTFGTCHRRKERMLSLHWTRDAQVSSGPPQPFCWAHIQHHCQTAGVWAACTETWGYRGSLSPSSR